MPIRDMARTDVVIADPWTSAPDLPETLERENVGSVVITEGDEPVGIVTDRDLALDIVGQDADAAEITAADIMTADLFTAETDERIYDVLEGSSTKRS